MSKLARAATYLERYAQEIEAAHTIGSRWDNTEAKAEHDELLELAAALRAEPERKVEPVAAPAGYFCEPYLNKPGLFEQVFNGFDDPDVIPLYRDPNGRIAALEREVEALRNPNNDLNQLRELISDSFDAGYSAYSDFDTSKCRTVKQEQYVEEVMERLVDKALAAGEAQ